MSSEERLIEIRKYLVMRLLSDYDFSDNIDDAEIGRLIKQCKALEKYITRGEASDE